MQRVTFIVLAMAVVLLLPGCSDEALTSNELIEAYDFAEGLIGLTSEELDSTLTYSMWRCKEKGKKYTKTTNGAEHSVSVLLNKAGVVYYVDMDIESTSWGLSVVSDDSYRTLLDKFGQTYKLNGTEDCVFQSAYYYNLGGGYEYIENYNEYKRKESYVVSADESQIDWGEYDKSQVFLKREFGEEDELTFNIRSAKYAD